MNVRAYLSVIAFMVLSGCASENSTLVSKGRDSGLGFLAYNFDYRFTHVRINAQVKTASIRVTPGQMLDGEAILSVHNSDPGRMIPMIFFPSWRRGEFKVVAARMHSHTDYKVKFRLKAPKESGIYYLVAYANFARSPEELAGRTGRQASGKDHDVWNMRHDLLWSHGKAIMIIVGDAKAPELEMANNRGNLPPGMFSTKSSRPRDDLLSDADIMNSGQHGDVSSATVFEKLSGKIDAVIISCSESSTNSVDIHAQPARKLSLKMKIAARNAIGEKFAPVILVPDWAPLKYHLVTSWLQGERIFETRMNVVLPSESGTYYIELRTGPVMVPTQLLRQGQPEHSFDSGRAVRIIVSKKSN